MRTTLAHWLVLGLMCLPAAGQRRPPQLADGPWDMGGTGVAPVLSSFLGSTGFQPFLGFLGAQVAIDRLEGGATRVARDRLEGGAPQRDGRDARTTRITQPTLPEAHTLDFPNFENVPYVIESGLLDNPSDEYAVVFSHEVRLPGAAWLRLFYDNAVLPGDSRVRVTSLLDGDVQELNAAILAQWGNTSAYFNGDRVLLELVAGPGTRGNELNLEHVQKQRFDRPGGDDTQAASICGADDRVPSNEDWAGRIYEEGCSGAIFTTSSAMIGAGHCANTNQVLQFRVPPSLPTCDIVQPPADEQFPILPGWLYECCTVGEDWWVARVGQNGLGQRPFDRYGQLRHVVIAAAPIGAFAEVIGYGGDSTPCTSTQTQQYSPGTILNVAATSYGYTNDTTGGSSGSAIVYNKRIVGVHTHSGACATGNLGTKASNADFASARQAIAPACITDLTGDGLTDQMDLARLLAAYNKTAGEAAYDYVSDIDDDDLVGQSDLAALLAAYGTSCP